MVIYKIAKKLIIIILCNIFIGGNKKKLRKKRRVKQIVSDSLPIIVFQKVTCLENVNLNFLGKVVYCKFVC